MKINKMWLLSVTLLNIIVVNAIPEVDKAKKSVSVKAAKSKVSPSLVAQAEANLSKAQALLEGKLTQLAQSNPEGPAGAALEILSQITSATPTQYKQAQVLIQQANVNAADTFCHNNPGAEACNSAAPVEAPSNPVINPISGFIESQLPNPCTPVIENGVQVGTAC